MKRKKKFVELGALIVVIAFMFSGGSSPVFAKKTKQVAYLTPGLTLPFWNYLAKGIENEAKAHGYKSITYDSNNDAAKQLANAEDAIARKVDGILISPTDSSTCPSVLKLAQNAGIPVVIADIGTQSGKYVSFIISDNYNGAYKVGQLLVKKLHAKGWSHGPVGLVTISLARLNGQKRTAGFRRALSEGGVKECAIQQMHRYTGDETFKYVQDMITAHPDMHGLFIETDQPTLGAVRAVRAARMNGKILIAGFDGIPEFVKLIKSGKIIGSGMQQPYLMGERSMQAMLDFFEGKTPPKQILVPIKLVSQDNISKVLPVIKKTVFANELK